MNGSVVDTVLEVSYFSGRVLFPNLLLRSFVAVLVLPVIKWRRILMHLIPNFVVNFIIPLGHNKQ